MATNRRAPTFEVLVNGENLFAATRARVVSLSYEESEERDDELRLDIVDPYGQLVDDARLQEGAKVEVRWGYAGALGPARLGVLLDPTYSFGADAVKINLRARDLGSRLHGNASQEVFQGLTSSQIVEQLATKHGLTPNVTPTDLVHESMPQGNRSDWDFIHYLADQAKFVAWVEDDRLYWGPRPKTDAPVLTIQFFPTGAPSPAERLLVSFSPESRVQETKGPATATQVIGYDMERQEAVEHTATEATAQDTRLAPRNVRVDAETGTTSPDDPQAIPNGDKGLIIPSPHEDLAKVTAEAEKTREDAELKTATARLAILGHTAARPKRTIRLAGFAKKFDGVWYIVEARHQVGGSGYTTDLAIRRDGFGGEQGAEVQRPVNDQEGPAPVDAEVPKEEVVAVDAEGGRIL